MNDSPPAPSDIQKRLNRLLGAVFAPLCRLLAPFCATAISYKKNSEELHSDQEESQYIPRYLDRSLINTPTLALSMVRRELWVMSDLIDKMIAEIPAGVFTGNLEIIANLQQMDDQVDSIHHAITHYLARISSSTLPANVTDDILAATIVSSEMESIGDIIENNIIHLVETASQGDIVFSQASIESLGNYHKLVQQNFTNAAQAFVSGNKELAIQVIAIKDQINAMDISCRNEHMHSLHNGDNTQRSISTYTLQMDIRENLKRIYYHTKRIAKVVTRNANTASWTQKPKTDTPTPADFPIIE